MLVCIMRHGIASERDEWGGSDETRPLTQEGRKRTEQVLKALCKDRSLQMDAVWTSPLVRAEETASIAGKVLNAPVQVVDALASGTELSRVEKALRKLAPLPQRLMLVGHEPDCGYMIGELTGDPHGLYSLKRAGTALLEGDFQSGKMKLIWLLQPNEVLND